MEPRKGGMVPYVPKPLERISETAIVEHKPTGLPLRSSAVQGHTGDPVKDLEAKLKFIQEHVPTRISNVSGSTAGSGSGDFHQYRMARRREQFRLERMDKEALEAEAQRTFEEKQQQREQEADLRTERNRLKRAKKKDKRKGKKPRTEGGAQPGGGAGGAGSGSDESDSGAGDPAAADLD